jgi:hypothetical protein
VAPVAGGERGAGVRFSDRIDFVKTARLMGAAIALLAAVAVVFVAEDVRRWPGRIEAGDLRYFSGSTTEDWRPSDRLPLRLGDDLLKVDDDLALRRALVLFRGEHESADENRSASEHIQLQSLLEQALVDVEDGAEDPRRRSQAANLLGVLYFDMAQSAGPGGDVFLDRTLAALRRAVILDPANVDAKMNLELLLTLMSEQEEARSPRFGRGTSLPGGGQVGLRPPGEGY